MCVYKYSIYRYCTLLICTLFVYIVCYASLGMYVTPLRPEPDAHMLCKLIKYMLWCASTLIKHAGMVIAGSAKGTGWHRQAQLYTVQGWFCTTCRTSVCWYAAGGPYTRARGCIRSTMVHGVVSSLYGLCSYHLYTGYVLDGATRSSGFWPSLHPFTLFGWCALMYCLFHQHVHCVLRVCVSPTPRTTLL